MKNYKILIIALGYIGKNLALSLIDKGFEISSDLININADKKVRDVTTIVIRKIKKIM